MAEERKHDCGEDCEHKPEFERRPPLDEGEKAEPKHTESGLTPLVPTGA